MSQLNLAGAASMDSLDIEVLLGMVKDLDMALDGCLADATQAQDAIPRILETCRQMRAKEITGPIHYWLGAIEQHARRIGNPGARSGTDAHFLPSDAYWRIRLRKDIYSLRTQLVNAAR